MRAVNSKSNSILIVDDSPSNLKLLFDFLTEYGFDVWVSRNGKSAIEKVKYSVPDLILLDVLMPGMDGFETCQHLKALPSAQDIPIIFMTALADTDNKVKGFNVGAVDYITKPIQQEEVLVRLKTHLSIGQLTHKLQAQNVCLQQEIIAREKLALELEKRVEERTLELTQINQQLQQEIQERSLAEETLQRSLLQLQQTQAQLIQSEKMSALGQMVAGIAHEINNPVNFIYGNLSHIHGSVSDVLKILSLYQKIYPNPDSEILEEAEEIDLEFIQEDLPKMLSSMKVGAERIRQIVLSLRRFSHQDGLEMKPTPIHEGLDSTLMILQTRLKSKPDRPAINLIKEYCPNLPLVECYGGEMNQVFMNILANAIEALEEYNEHRSLEEIHKNPSVIRISTDVIPHNQIVIRIADNGCGMPQDVRDRIFDPFFTTKPPGKGTGIGLSISWQIVVKKHQGHLYCLSSPGNGTEFIIQLPISSSSDNFCKAPLQNLTI